MSGDTMTGAAPDKPTSGEDLRQSEERFRLMVGAVKDYGIFLLDPKGYISSWNEGAQRIKGYTAEEIIGQHFSKFYPPEALAKNWPEHELEVAKKEGRFEDEGWRVRKDGSLFWANVIITAIWNDDGELIGFTKVTRDLSERRGHEEALQQSQNRLEEANEELSRKNRELQDFAYVASHDLQEPLRKVRTFSDLLEQDYEGVVDEQGRMYLDRIRDAITRMSTLIQELLAFSRTATQQQQLQPVDLNEIIAEVVGDLQIVLDETHGKVEYGGLPTIEADPMQMRQLFQNLIGNALKYHRPDVPPVVRINATRQPNAGPLRGQAGLSITVADNGIGFDDKYAEDIFAPFRRLHARREYEGTGLGLAICRRIAERHGGTITAESRPGEGSTFTVYLPARLAVRIGGD